MSDNQFSRSTAHQLSAEDAARIQAQFFIQVFGWMAAGLAFTGGTALFTAATPALVQFISGSPLIYLGLVLVTVVIAGFLANRIFQWSRTQVQFTFIGYSILNGLTLSGVLLHYTSTSIASTFFTTAIMFGVTSAFGYFTKLDLSGWGKMLSMMLIGLVISMVVNIFLHSSGIAFITSFVGVILFTALAAFHTQKLKDIAFLGVTEGEDVHDKASILGALVLYLDFVNLFLFLLRFTGVGSDRRR
jgi:FtsH-binding integral membrane protein